MDYARLQTPYVSVKTNPFRDHRVRLAIASVIDGEALVAEALQGNGSPLAQMVVPEAFGYAPGHAAAPLTRSDCGQSSTPAEAGFGSGFEVTLDFEGAADSRSPVVEVLSRQVARIGIRIKPRPHATQDLLPRVEARDTSFYLLSWVGTSGDLGSTAEFLLRTPSEGRGTDNGGGYSSQETERALLDAAAATLDAEARLSLLRKVEERIRLDVPVIPLLRREDLYGVAAGVSFDLRLDREIRGATLVVGPR